MRGRHEIETTVSGDVDRNDIDVTGEIRESVETGATAVGNVDLRIQVEAIANQ